MCAFDFKFAVGTPAAAGGTRRRDGPKNDRSPTATSKAKPIASRFAELQLSQTTVFERLRSSPSVQKAMSKNRVFVVGVGMTPFVKPGGDKDYPEVRFFPSRL